ncbi:hypothetical protein DCW30_35235 [Streptomyces alfalfae]|uniref:hypothetical protein n=1 Tax=Streptomyces alfalfae TaxID=1642299 RepID=UPI000975480F|nr:hypothetical protein [Streptomyces alfalfae]AYA20613.1 hypothetical protein D3X13_34140 [Streptomyces fradiae]RXX34820.1 hypothetical protein DCW30_35235 [Streptomyces alfalfae]RZN02820.1 hypothetical protein D4104_05785 [Streptomyces alfalfae]
MTACLTGHTGKVRWVAIAADGTWLASASDDTTVRIRERATRQELSRFTCGCACRVVPAVPRRVSACLVLPERSDPVRDRLGTVGAWLGPSGYGWSVPVSPGCLGRPGLVPRADPGARGAKNDAQPGTPGPDGTFWTSAESPSARARGT